MKKVMILLALMILSLSVFSAPIVQGYLLEVSSSSQSPDTIRGGDYIVLTINITNRSSSASAEDVQIELNLGDDFTGTDTLREIGLINNNQTKTISFKFKVRDDILGGTYALPLVMTYLRNGVKTETTETISVTISDAYTLDIDIDASNSQPHIGEELNIIVRVTNTSSRTARNVSVRLSQAKTKTFSDFVLLNSSKQVIGNIDAGKSKNAIFSIRPSKNITPGLFSLTADANCLDCLLEDSEIITIDVLGRPNLIISGIEYSVEGAPSALEKAIRGGSNFTFSIQMDNIGKENAKAVEVELREKNIEGESSIKGPMKTYVGSIEADDSGAAVFDLTASALIQEGDHDFEIIITYLDELDLKQSISQDYSLYIHPAPAPDLIGPLILLIILVVLVYITAKMIFRQLAMRKA